VAGLPDRQEGGRQRRHTISQAIGLCPTLRLCEPDPVHYDQQFAQLLTALGAVSPVIEPAELGRVFVGMDGLEGLYGEPEHQVREIQMRSAEYGMRVGWGRESSFPGSLPRVRDLRHAVIVRPGKKATFLAAQPLAVLPLDRHAPPAAPTRSEESPT
jgi:hypothetical protein